MASRSFGLTTFCSTSSGRISLWAIAKFRPTACGWVFCRFCFSSSKIAFSRQNLAERKRKQNGHTGRSRVFCSSQCIFVYRCVNEPETATFLTPANLLDACMHYQTGREFWISLLLLMLFCTVVVVVAAAAVDVVG